MHHNKIRGPRELQEMDRDIRILIGCEGDGGTCGRRVHDGVSTIAGCALVSPIDAPESDERIILCREHYSEWLDRRLFPNGFDL